MIESWKVPHIGKGMLTYIPLVNTLRARRGSTGGSNSSNYCYAVWLRHLVVLARCGFTVQDAVISELGPGDSIGTGLAALLSGARRYIGLDLVPYSTKANLDLLLHELVALYSRRAPIPDHHVFPRMRPRLASYAFPEHLVDTAGLTASADRLRAALTAGLEGGSDISYRAPWTSISDIEAGSIDLIFSQAVLQHIDDLRQAYAAMFVWLKPGGYCSHSIGFRAHYVAPFWNGHWAYSDLEWRIVRGRREWLLNRQPMSTHLALARQAGFDVVEVERRAGSRWASTGEACYALQNTWR